MIYRLTQSGKSSPGMLVLFQAFQSITAMLWKKENDNVQKEARVVPSIAEHPSANYAQYGRFVKTKMYILENSLLYWSGTFFFTFEPMLWI